MLPWLNLFPECTTQKLEAVIKRYAQRVSLDSVKRQLRVVPKIPFRSLCRQVTVLHTESHALIQPVAQPRERLIGEHGIRSAGVYALEIGESTKCLHPGWPQRFRDLRQCTG